VRLTDQHRQLRAGGCGHRAAGTCALRTARRRVAAALRTRSRNCAA
jgi:hypothetical protein